MIPHLSQLIDQAKNNPKTVAIAAAEDSIVLAAAKEAAEHGIASFILFGQKRKSRK